MLSVIIVVCVLKSRRTTSIKIAVAPFSYSNNLPKDIEHGNVVGPVMPVTREHFGHPVV